LEEWKSANNPAVWPQDSPSKQTHHARGIIDIGQRKLSDVPFALEEALRKTPGVLSVQLNAFSGKLVVEFDSSIISLDKIRKQTILAK